MAGQTAKNIRLKLIIPYAVSLLIIVLSIQLLLYFYQNNKQQAYADNLNVELNRSLINALNVDTSKITAFIRFSKTNDDIKQAWKSQDRAVLLQKSTPIYHWLRAQHQITHFYFHNTNGNNFLRVHAPEKFGDMIERETMRKSMYSLDIASGIEIGIFNEFVLRTVSPWYEDGELLGFIELGKEINHIIDRISEVQNLQIIFSIPNKLASRVSLNTNNIKSVNHNENSDHTIIFTSLHSFTPELEEFIYSDYSPTAKIIRHNNTHYLASNILLRNFNGNDTARLTYLYDFDKNVSHDNNFLWSTLAANTVVGIILLLFYYYYSGTIKRALSESYAKLENQIQEREAAEMELLEHKQQLEELIKERDKSLSESKRRYRTLFEKTADALLLIENDRFIDCNQAMLDMFMYNSKEEIYNTHPSQISPEFQEDGQASSMKADLMMQTALEHGSHRFEWNHARKNGEIFPAEVLLTAIPAGDKQLLHAVVRDISSRKQAEEEIKYRAYYDSLTRLPNRQLLLDRLKHAVITGRRRSNYNALLFIDLDRFKTINDSLGHSIGDLLLIEAARRIRSCIREEDTASRFGGDEFVILIKNLGTRQEQASLLAKRIAEDIQLTFKEVFKLKDHELHISSSIGITLFPLHDESMEDIIKHADTAMYSAKESGRNKIAFYLAEMHDTVLKRLTLEKDLRRAVNEQALSLHYQPQVNNTGDVVGVEALIRWQHPEHGFISPEDFISIAEDTGIIYDIGEFVLNQSVEDILALDELGCLPKHLSINISPHQFMHPDFVTQVKQLIQLHHIEHNFLTLEVTEGIVISNLAETIEKFEQLRKLGVRMSLDDFGTGYSSLSYLKRLPLDELKIDKSFVFDMLRDPHDALLVQTIINIANQFGLDTVAEGVEDEHQLHFLKEKSCMIYQGYYYSRPLPIDDLKSFLCKN